MATTAIPTPTTILTKPITTMKSPPAHPSSPSPSMVTAKGVANTTAAPPIQRPEDVSNDTFSALLIGSSGSGKTSMALTSPRPIHFLDVDRKLHQLAKVKNMTEVTFQQFAPNLTGSKRITVFKAPDTNPLKGADRTLNPLVYTQVTNAINEFYDILERGEELPFKTLVLDTLSQLGVHLEMLIMKDNGHTSMTMGDWRIYLQNMISLLTGLIGLPCNVVVGCHDRVEISNDPDSAMADAKMIRVYPHIPGQTAEIIGGYFQEVYYLIPKVVGDRMQVEALTMTTRKYTLRSSLTDINKVPPDFQRILAGEFRGEKGRMYLANKKGASTGTSAKPLVQPQAQPTAQPAAQIQTQPTAKEEIDSNPEGE